MSSIEKTGLVCEQFAGRAGKEVAGVGSAFDQRHYLELIRTRGETIRRLLPELKAELHLRTALDAGCGVGFFAQVLQENGLRVQGFDGRLGNVIEARHRFPQIAFAQQDVEDSRVLDLGRFDLVLCFGLLYHVENPMLAIRHLRAMTKTGMLLESMCAPGEGTGMVLREEPDQEDQSLTDIALYPSESCLVKMLYRAGFAAVYRVKRLPDHEDFRETRKHARRRTMLFAATAKLQMAGLDLMAEPGARDDLWTRTSVSTGVPKLRTRVKRFLARPFGQKCVALALKARRVLPEMRIPLRLPGGVWWIAEKSALDHDLVHAGAGHCTPGFEQGERRFVEQFLKPGMTVLDVGAHHGLYTLMASKFVGSGGRVVAFEPSPRERRRLRRHKRINALSSLGFSNVKIVPYALGESEGQVDLFLVEGAQDWCNSLRPPSIGERTSRIRVEMRRLDDVVDEMGIAHVSLLKIDVEGAELSVLRGAKRLLASTLRPTILIEVQDVRTRPWGYEAREIVRFLTDAGYWLYTLDASGQRQLADLNLPTYETNLVAYPSPRSGDPADCISM
jgi:FkbM family methyltransferase